MTRVLYRWLLWLHPPAFRQEFAGEMMWIFEEASASEGVAPLFADGLVSLLRQWLLRSGSWRIAAAIVGGLLEVTAGGFGMLVFGHGQIVAHLAAAPLKEPPTPAAALALDTLIRLAAWSVTGVLLMVVVLVLWVRSLNGRRLHRLSAFPHAALLRR
ncbi:MAG: hypothetical protein LAQ69_01410 [Acidobacteriia bacterium]|nr:hypothetical protein [Terriglobia bacterium]